MPIRFTIDHEKRFVHACAEGEATLKDVEAFLDAVIIENALPYRKLFDGRTAIPIYVQDDMMLLGARASAYASLERRGPVAFLPNPRHAELAGRFINLGKSGRAARIFYEEDEARLWLEAQSEA
jgi:hypothetical protein